MLFNLSCCRNFPSKKAGGEIVGSSVCGPYFGDNELIVCNELFDAGEECCSRTNGKNFGIPEEDGKNMLTNLKNSSFSITELEVWEVTEIEK